MLEKANSLSLVRPVQQTLTPMLSIDDLSLFYGNESAFRSVTMPVYRHQITAIIGPSGCGKSSLLNALSGLSRLDTSSRLSGNIIHNNPSGTNTIGMIFQQPAPFPFSIYKNFEIPLREHGVKKKNDIKSRMESCLREVGLWPEVYDKLDKAANQLSGGQQQRLCIARALALDPDILLLDEPCSALDPDATMLIENLLLKLKQRHTILMVTHNLAQARRISDFTALLWHCEQNASLIEFKPTSALFSEPEKAITRAYLGNKAG